MEISLAKPLRNISRPMFKAWLCHRDMVYSYNHEYAARKVGYSEFLIRETCLQEKIIDQVLRPASRGPCFSRFR